MNVTQLKALARLAARHDHSGRVTVADALDAVLVKIAEGETGGSFEDGFKEGLLTAIKILNVSEDVPTIKKFLHEAATSAGAHVEEPERINYPTDELSYPADEMEPSPASMKRLEYAIGE